jgi:hypothetical protein
MEYVINIHSRGQEINLTSGKYNVDILGGWGIDLGQFAGMLINRQSAEVITCKRTFWRVQSFAFKKRAKRIFSIDISQDGTYKVEFMNSKTLRVKEYNLFITSFFEEPVPNEKIDVYIH